MATEMLTLEQLNELAALEQTATAGNWLQGTHVGEPRALCPASARMTSLLGLDVDGMAIVQEEADASLIAASRNALPALLAMAKRLLELTSALRFIERECGSLVLGGDRGYFNAGNAVYEAKRLGWQSPTAKVPHDV
jgi:hypothetical protein